MRPVICMITDGRTGQDRSVDRLIKIIGDAAHAGVDLIQIRERGLDDRALAQLVRDAVASVRGTPARVLVNDRLDVARAAGAHGVHLRSDSFPAERLRDVTGSRFLIGRSVHSVDDVMRSAARDGSIDYLIFGTVFPTPSKPGAAAAGVTALADVVRATSVPVLAVGGVTVENASLVARGGAAGIAAIGLFAERASRSIADTVECVMGAFDSVRAGS
jgi:thiamine-phosphate pyrophosphorylase